MNLARFPTTAVSSDQGFILSSGVPGKYWKMYTTVKYDPLFPFLNAIQFPPADTFHQINASHPSCCAELHQL
jgi:hypothetical protein